MRVNTIPRGGAALACAILIGCTSSTGPGSTHHDDGGAAFDGSVDPAGSTFLLQRVVQSAPPELEPIILDLVGSNLEVDVTNETVSVDVAVRNASSLSLYPPGLVWVGRFVPATVQVLNPDVVIDSVTTDDRPLRVAFDYSRLLGEDGVLTPGESSGRKRWIFHDPGLGAFSFGAAARFAVVPDRAHISGVVFLDLDRDGVRDTNDEPLAAGHISMMMPSGERMGTSSGADGRYAFPVNLTGLYSLRFSAPFDGPWDGPFECYTTPNPLSVVLGPGSDGGPRSFERADFGYFHGPCDPPFSPVVMTGFDPDDIYPQDFYHYLGGELRGDVLTLDVGYSGCSEEHPFVLYISKSFMESLPVQTWALVSHDDLGEHCDAYFERTLRFHLGPLRESYIESYGEPGLVRIWLRDHHGDEHEFMFGP